MVKPTRPVCYGDLIYLEASAYEGDNTDGLGFMCADGLTSDACHFRLCKDPSAPQDDDLSLTEEAAKVGRFPDDTFECIFEVFPMFRYTAQKELARLTKSVEEEEDLNRVDPNERVLVLFQVLLSGADKGDMRWGGVSEAEVEAALRKGLPPIFDNRAEVRVHGHSAAAPTVKDKVEWQLFLVIVSCPNLGSGKEVAELLSKAVDNEGLVGEYAREGVVSSGASQRPSDQSSEGLCQGILRLLSPQAVVTCRIPAEPLMFTAEEESRAKECFDRENLDMDDELSVTDVLQIISHEWKAADLQRGNKGGVGEAGGERAADEEALWTLESAKRNALKALRRLGCEGTDAPVKCEQFVACYVQFSRDKRQAEAAARAQRAPGERARLRQRCEDEKEHNEKLARKKRGAPLRCGDIVQLRHVRSGKYVRVDMRLFANIAAHGKAVKLESQHTDGTVSCYLRLAPYFSYYQEGELIMPDMSVKIETVKAGGKLLSVSRKPFEARPRTHELCFAPSTVIGASGARDTAWKMFVFRQHDLDQATSLLTGEALMLRHSAASAHLVCEEARRPWERGEQQTQAVSPSHARSYRRSTSGLASSNGSPLSRGNQSVVSWGGHSATSLLQHRVVLLSSDDGEEPPTSSLWVLEEETPGSSLPVHESRRFRVRHLNTRGYLGVRQSDLRAAQRRHQGRRGGQSEERDARPEPPRTVLVDLCRSRVSDDPVCTLWRIIPKKASAAASYRPGTFSFHLVSAVEAEATGMDSTTEPFEGARCFLSAGRAAGSGRSRRAVLGGEDSDSEVLTAVVVDPRRLWAAKAAVSKAAEIRAFSCDILDTFRDADIGLALDVADDSNDGVDTVLRDPPEHVQTLVQTRVLLASAHGVFEKPEKKSARGSQRLRAEEEEEERLKAEGARLQGWQVRLAAGAERTALALSQMVMFSCRNEQGMQFTDRWEESAKAGLEFVMPRASDPSRQAMLRQCGVMQDLYILVALCTAKLQEIELARPPHKRGGGGPGGTAPEVQTVEQEERRLQVRADEEVERRLQIVCKLVYKLVQHFCYGSRENEIYIAQSGWIDNLMIAHVGSDNNVSQCMRDVLHDNEMLLDLYINESTLNRCIELIRTKGIKAFQYLDFLKGVVTCDKKPVVSNQKELLSMLLTVPRDESLLIHARYRAHPDGRGALKEWVPRNDKRAVNMREKAQDKHFRFIGKEDPMRLVDPESGEMISQIVEVSWSMAGFKNDDKHEWAPETLFRDDCVFDVLSAQGTCAYLQKKGTHITVDLFRGTHWEPAGSSRSRSDRGEEHHEQLLSRSYVISIGREYRTVLAAVLDPAPPDEGVDSMAIPPPADGCQRVTLHVDQAFSAPREGGRRDLAGCQCEIYHVERAPEVRGEPTPGGRAWVPLRVLSLYLKDECDPQDQTHRMELSRRQVEEWEKNRESLGGRGHLTPSSPLPKGGMTGTKVQRLPLQGPEAKTPIGAANVRRSEVARYFLHQVKLLSEMCYGRNYDCIAAVHEEYSLPLILSVIRDETGAGCGAKKGSEAPRRSTSQPAENASTMSLGLKKIATMSRMATMSRRASHRRGEVPKDARDSPGEASVVKGRHPSRSNGHSDDRQDSRLGMPLPFRSAFASLLNVLWIDVHPQKEFVLPFVTVPFAIQRIQYSYGDTPPTFCAFDPVTTEVDGKVRKGTITRIDKGSRTADVEFEGHANGASAGATYTFKLQDLRPTDMRSRLTGNRLVGMGLQQVPPRIGLRVVEKFSVNRVPFASVQRQIQQGMAKMWERESPLEGTIVAFDDEGVTVKWDDRPEAPVRFTASPDLSIQDIVLSDVQIFKPPDTSKFFLIEQIIEDHIEKLGGRQDAFNPPEAELTSQFLAILERLCRYGLYNNIVDIRSIADKLLSLLDGRNDNVTIPKDIPKGDDEVEINRHVSRSTRFCDTSIIMESKKTICRILSLINCLRLEFQLNIVMRHAESLLLEEANGEHSATVLDKSVGERTGETMWHDKLKDYSLSPPVLETEKSKLLCLYSSSKDKDKFDNVLLDSLLYDDSELVESAVRLLMERAQHTQTLVNIVKDSQVLDWHFAPADLVSFCFREDIARYLISLGVDLSPFWYRPDPSEKNIVSNRDPLRFPREDGWFRHISAELNASKSLELIMMIIGDVQDALECYEATHVGSGDEFVFENLQLLVRLTDSGADYALAMRERLGRGGVFTIFERALNLQTFPSRSVQENPENMERMMRARKVLELSSRLMANVISGSEHNRRAAIPLLDRLLGRARKLNEEATLYSMIVADHSKRAPPRPPPHPDISSPPPDGGKWGNGIQDGLMGNGTESENLLQAFGRDKGILPNVAGFFGDVAGFVSAGRSSGGQRGAGGAMEAEGAGGLLLGGSWGQEGGRAHNEGMGSSKVLWKDAREQQHEKDIAYVRPRRLSAQISRKDAEGSRGECVEVASHVIRVVLEVFRGSPEVCRAHATRARVSSLLSMVAGAEHWRDKDPSEGVDGGSKGGASAGVAAPLKKLIDVVFDILEQVMIPTAPRKRGSRGKGDKALKDKQELVLRETLLNAPLRNLLDLGRPPPARELGEMRGGVRGATAAGNELDDDEGDDGCAPPDKETFQLATDNVATLLARGTLHLRTRVCSLLAACCSGSKTEMEVDCQVLHALPDLCALVCMKPSDGRWGGAGRDVVWRVKEACAQFLLEVYVETDVETRYEQSDTEAMGAVVEFVADCLEAAAGAEGGGTLTKQMDRGEGADGGRRGEAFALRVGLPLVASYLSVAPSRDSGNGRQKRLLMQCVKFGRRAEALRIDAKNQPLAEDWDCYKEIDKATLDGFHAAVSSAHLALEQIHAFPLRGGGEEDGEHGEGADRSAVQQTGAAWGKVSKEAKLLGAEYRALMRGWWSDAAGDPAQIEFTTGVATVIAENADVRKAMEKELDYIVHLLKDPAAPDVRDRVDEPAADNRGEAEANRANEGTVEAGSIIKTLIMFLQDRLHQNDEAHTRMNNFVLHSLRRMVELDLQQHAAAKKVAESRGSSEKHRQMADAENKWRATQCRIAKRGAPELVRRIICSEDAGSIHSATLQLATSLLEMGNLTVQQLFLEELTQSPVMLVSMRAQIQRNLDLSRKQIKMNKKAGGDAGKGMGVRAEEGFRVEEGFHLLLRFIQQLCEGHFLPMKDFLREQPRQDANINIVKDMTYFFSTISQPGSRGLLHSIDKLTLEQLLYSLTETTQGPCVGNQNDLIAASLHEYCANLINMPVAEYEKNGAPPQRAFLWSDEKEGIVEDHVGESHREDDHSLLEPCKQEPTTRSSLQLVKTKRLDLLACKRAAVTLVLALLEGVTNPKQARLILDGLDVQVMVRSLQDSIRSLPREARSMGYETLNLGIFSGRASGRREKKLRERKAEEVLEMEVMEMMFTLLRALDEISPFLHREILSLEHRELTAAPASNILEHYSNTAGSVEILRNNRVEKYVFRYNPNFKPSDFVAIIDIETIQQEILMASRLSNPQRRLNELVTTTVDMHFEIQHMRTVDSWPRLGPTLRLLRYRRKTVELAAFALVVLLNFVLLFAYFYEEEDLERLSSEAWNVTSDVTSARRKQSAAIQQIESDEDKELPYVSAGLEYISYNRELDIMVITFVLSVVLIPLHSATLIQYLCYRLPVKLNKRYSKSGKMPELSIFDGRIDKGVNMGLTMRRDGDTTVLHYNSLSKQDREGLDSAATSAWGTEVLASQRRRDKWRGWIYSYLDPTKPAGAAWTFLIVVLTVFEIIISAIEDFVWNDPIRDKEVALIDWVCIAVFLLDLALRVGCLGSRFFFERKWVRRGTTQRFERKWQEFNIFDGTVVLVWAALMVTKEFHSFSSSLTASLLCLRLARVARAVVLLYRVANKFLEMGVAQPNAVSGSSGVERKKGRWSAWFLCGLHVVTDLRFLTILVYIVTTLLATIGVLRHMENEESKFSFFLNPMWYCIGMAEMVRRLPTLPNVFRAITIRRAELLQTTALGVYVIYLFSTTAFVLIPVAMSQAHGASCTTGIQCFFLVFEVGLATGDVSQGMLPIDYQDGNYVTYYIFVVAFVILITLVLLNVIFGIIIDSFGQLRGEQEEVAKQMLNQCFICGKERHLFEDPGVETTFNAHVNKEHRVWDYVCFIVYIACKKPTELTGTEAFVIRELQQSKCDWFPFNRALVTEDGEGRGAGGSGAAGGGGAVRSEGEESLPTDLATHKATHKAIAALEQRLAAQLEAIHRKIERLALAGGGVPHLEKSVSGGGDLIGFEAEGESGHSGGGGIPTVLGMSSMWGRLQS